MGADEAVVDQHHTAGPRVVQILEVTAGHDRYPQRVEVAGTDVDESRQLALVSREARASKK